MSTRDAIQARCESRFRDTSNAIVSDAEWVNLIQEGYDEVINSSPFWPFLKSRVTNLSITANAEPATTTLAVDTFRIRALWNATDKVKMEPIEGEGEYRRLYELDLHDDHTGPPQHYRVQGRTLEVFPTPTVTTTLHADVEVRPAALGATDEPTFPEEFHSMLADWALAQAYLDDGNSEQFSIRMEMFATKLKALQARLVQNQQEGYAQIVDKVPWA